MIPRWKPNAGAGKDAFRWAIIGYGNVAVAHTEGIREACMRLVGFSTSKMNVRQGDATELEFNIGPTKGRHMDMNGIYAFSNAEDMLSQLYGTADGVIVCAPTDKHLTLVREVGITGMHCLVEKPIAGSARDARAMIEFCGTKRGGLLCGHILPCFPEFDFLRRRVLEKGVEKIETLTMNRFIPWADTDDEKRTVAAEGWMKDLLVHDAQLVSSLGKPTSVQIRNEESRYNLLQNGEMSVKLENVSGMFTLRGGAHRDHKQFHHSYEARFQDGTLLAFDGTSVTENGAPVHIEQLSVAQIWAKELKIAAAYFQGEGDAQFLDPVMALNALKILEGAFQSATSSSGEIVKI